jgi:hypothetical protein
MDRDDPWNSSAGRLVLMLFRSLENQSANRSGLGLPRRARPRDATELGVYRLAACERVARPAPRHSETTLAEVTPAPPSFAASFCHPHFLPRSEAALRALRVSMPQTVARARASNTYRIFNTKKVGERENLRRRLVLIVCRRRRCVGGAGLGERPRRPPSYEPEHSGRMRAAQAGSDRVELGPAQSIQRRPRQ